MPFSTAALDHQPRPVDPVFGLQIPRSCPGVPPELLIPRNTWKDAGSLRRQGQRTGSPIRRELRAIRPGGRAAKSSRRAPASHESCRYNRRPSGPGRKPARRRHGSVSFPHRRCGQPDSGVWVTRYTTAATSPVPIPETIGDHDSRARYAREIGEACESLYQRSRDSILAGHLPLSLGGDHSLAAGSIAGTAAALQKQNRALRSIAG